MPLQSGEWLAHMDFFRARKVQRSSVACDFPTIRRKMSETEVDECGLVPRCDENIGSFEVLVAETELMQGMNMNAKSAEEVDEVKVVPLEGWVESRPGEKSGEDVPESVNLSASA